MADKELRDTLDYCMANEQALEDAIKYKKYDNTRRGSGRKASISKPTEMAALWNLSSVGPVLVNDYWLVDEPERTLSAIRYTKAHYSMPGDKYGIIYKARYLDGEKPIDTCSRMGLADSTYFDRVNVIKDYAETVWSKLRCLD